MNWDDPTERADLIERVGCVEYNRLLQEHQDNTTVNGVRPVHSPFGLLYMVVGTKIAFSSREEAEKVARTHVKTA